MSADNACLQIRFAFPSTQTFMMKLYSLFLLSLSLSEAFHSRLPWISMSRIIEASSGKENSMPMPISNHQHLLPQSTLHQQKTSLRRDLVRLFLGSAILFPFKGKAGSVSAVRASTIDELRCTSTSSSPSASLATLNIPYSDEVVKKLNDNRLYKALTLSNGLKVLLVSDADSQRAAAAIDVHVGQCLRFCMTTASVS
jgi:hypothetical protein